MIKGRGAWRLGKMAGHPSSSLPWTGGLRRLSVLTELAGGERRWSWEADRGQRVRRVHVCISRACLRARQGMMMANHTYSGENKGVLVRGRCRTRNPGGRKEEGGKRGFELVSDYVERLTASARQIIMMISRPAVAEKPRGSLRRGLQSPQSKC